MNGLVYPLRLWCGNKLDWLNGSGLDDLHGNPIERVYKHGVINNFSNTLLNLGWFLDLRALTEAFFGIEAVEKLEKLKNFIDYFSDVCARGPFLETKAPAAATLLDALTLMHASDNEHDLILCEEDFQKNVLPKLKDTIEGLDLPLKIKEPMKQALQLVHRTSFRSRLLQLSHSLDLGLEKPVQNIVIATRNKLVHDGKFPINKKVSSWTAYQCLLSTDYAILCRLTGYSGPLPSLS